VSQQQQQDVEDHYRKQRRHDLHTANLRDPGDERGETSEILRELSKVEDLPMSPQDDPVMGQLISKLSSTANLTPEQVRSNEWVREYILVLWLAKRPKSDGCHGAWRGWAHGDSAEALAPMDPETRLQTETLVTSSKLALSRSEGFTGPREVMRSIKESIAHDGDESADSGGILGRLGL